jgi:hypothetical protein
MDMAMQHKVAPSSEISQKQNGSPLGKGQELTCILTVPLWVEKSTKKDLFGMSIRIFLKMVFTPYICTNSSYQMYFFFL